MLWKEAGCTTELDYTEQTSWVLFLKYLDGLEQDKAMEAELEGKIYHFILDKPFRWESWAALEFGQRAKHVKNQPQPPAKLQRSNREEEGENEKLILATTALVTLTSAISHAQPNNIWEQSLASVNECYHGVHLPSPCTKNVYVISGLLHGTWKAVDKPWTLEFSPNGITDITDGTATMSTIGPPKTGKYHIQSGADDSDYAVITIDMDNGQHFRSDIAMFHSQLILVDSGKSTTFDRSSFSSN